MRAVYELEVITAVHGGRDRNIHQGSMVLSDTPNQTARYAVLIDTGGDRHRLMRPLARSVVRHKAVRPIARNVERGRRPRNSPSHALIPAFELAR